MFNVKEVAFDNVEFLVLFVKDLFTLEIVFVLFLKIEEGFLTKVMKTIGFFLNVLVKLFILAIREFFVGVIAIFNVTKDVISSVNITLLAFHGVTRGVDNLCLGVEVCFCFLKGFVTTICVSGKSKKTKG